MVQQDNTTPHQSSQYDGKVRQTIPFYETMHQETVDLVKTLQPGVACWLDTGCGTGSLVELALPAFPQTRFILADPAEAMLEQARGRFKGVGEARVSFLPPVSSEYLGQVVSAAPEVLTAIQCHHYLRPAGRKRALQACYDVLDEGGAFITFENVAPRTQRGVQIGLERWGRFQARAGRSQAVVESHLGRFGVAYFPITVDEHLQLLAEVGFRIVELLWFSHLQAGFYGIK
jgi:tRNA (cmo5U34)-methyltransferase